MPEVSQLKQYVDGIDKNKRAYTILKYGISIKCPKQQMKSLVIYHS